ncbi:hypothetical protein PHYBLDRAFT_137874 [Phycomyces blakesleeanus NRRL 1555(-)]|uniref:Uncharacterized protein n=1 Tax=Phycomyces blakesleeanus (strain ATCC 8743b / DSM 1359 / FGSC 10004 / NBRC 33097 / NRRL 1555) TaxID=763407 RepID=A0A167QV03_PHYB8|nr:hypothetical protein PHYBLDRAFT_137874 [Phycomyces blakesleeanus NRRL 1555(-)]OAD80319.1 hypothetical protein PHYBLDRAFT_137874 [Phycomyces blakesleeanus NRRL 1555(-)]|eukprot:XP_018298359.1 hypothetical protein PHYBLDRAFT_137874 [Phycomyces blakesleeanus NRRL 1555(-)]
MFDHVSISVLFVNLSSQSFTPTTDVLQGSVLSPHSYSIYINSLPPLLRTVTTSSSALYIPSPSPSSLDDYNTLLSPSGVTGFGHIMTPTSVNSLLFADDVAIFGSTRDVQDMLDLVVQHSFSLGYRWSPSKCAIIYLKTRSPQPPALTLYGEFLPAVEEFIYLDMPFRDKGIYAPSIVTHRCSGTIATMATLNSVGACRSEFSLLLSSRLYKTFVCPKFEYGLAISSMLLKDIANLEKIQNKFLRMIVGGHATSSTVVLKHICNLPSIQFRWDTLIIKFCIRANSLPSGCLLSLIHQHHPQFSSLPLLCQNKLHFSITARVNPRLPTALQKYFDKFRQEKYDAFRLDNNKILLQACHPIL